MRFWDSSALVPLLVAETTSEYALSELRADEEIVAWWATAVECTSAVVRLEREGLIEANAVRDALVRLASLQPSWNEVQPSVRVRDVALRLLRVHPLRAGDALQLAAAVVASEGSPGTLPFVSLDERLLLAAEREGFSVLRPAG